MKRFYLQKGMSLFSALTLLVVVGFLASSVFKVLPHYLDFFALEKILANVGKAADRNIKTPESLYAHVVDGMSVNNIRDANVNEMMSIEVVGDEFLVHVSYERRESLLGNVDLVVSFDKEISVPMP